MALTETQAKQFWDEGYLLLENFASAEEVEGLRVECKRIVDDMNPAEHNTVFSTTNQMERTSDDYFMTSGDKIRYFFEKGAKDDKGNLMVDKHLSINKIGHALHVLSEPFKKFTFSDRVKGIAKSLDFVDPRICQSMYIFKQPNIGGEVTPHQDSTFLYTDPMKLVGLWIALEDTTLENGCLWFIPGSHKEGVYGNYRMVRNPNKQPGDTGTIFSGENVKYDDAKFIAGPVKKGSLVLIHGEVAHKSEANTSTKSRHIYTFHMYEQDKTEYSPQNWLQPTKEMSFPSLYQFA